MTSSVNRLEVKGGVEFQGEFQVGEELLLMARCRVVKIEEDTVDVTQFGDAEPQYISGRRTATMRPIWAKVNESEEMEE